MEGLLLFHFFHIVTNYLTFFICNYTHFPHVSTLIVYMRSFDHGADALISHFFHNILFSSCVTIVYTFA
jgi:hypothetical protein